MNKYLIYFIFIMSCFSNIYVKLQSLKMHGLYSKIIFDRISEGKDGYPLYVDIMEDLRMFTLVYSSVILIVAIYLLFDKKINKLPKFLILFASLLAMLTQMMIS